jgi:putative endonuclease
MPRNPDERRAARHYRLRGYRILGANVHAGGYEIDLIARRGTRLVFVEVKERSRETYGGGVGAVNSEKRRRVRRAAASWLQAHPEAAALEIRFEVAAVSGGRVERLEFADDDSRREWREPPFR